MILTIFVIKVTVDMLYIFGNLVTQALLGWWKMSKIVKNFTPAPLKNLKEKFSKFIRVPVQFLKKIYPSKAWKGTCVLCLDHLGEY